MNKRNGFEWVVTICILMVALLAAHLIQTMPVVAASSLTTLEIPRPTAEPSRKSSAQPSLTAGPGLVFPTLVPPSGPLLERAPVLTVTKRALNEDGGPLYPGEHLLYTTIISNSRNIKSTKLVASDTISTHTNSVADNTSILSFAPVMTITKTGPLTATVRQQVVYSFAISHSGGDGSPIRNVIITDNMVGPVNYVGGDDSDGRLEVDETWTYTASYTVPPGVSDPLINTAEVVGTDNDGDVIVASDTHYLDIQGSIYLPIVLKPGPTILSVHNDHTGGNVTFIVRDQTTHAEITRCTVPNNATQPCDHDQDGSNLFPPGTYEVYVVSVCGPPATIIKTYDSGPETTRVFCK